jgi:hypothetical protein
VRILKPMRPMRKITILFLFPLFLFSISACAARPPITLTATSTPVPTNTPLSTLTLTPSPFPSPTKTLLPTEIPTATITPNPNLIKDFAGIYRKEQDNVYDCTLEIGRDSTFKLESHSKINGVLETVNGVISYSDGLFLLLWTSYTNGNTLFTWPEAHIEHAHGYQCFPEALIPIDWGERRYLFGTNEHNDDGFFETAVSFFCTDVKNGNEPRSSIDDIDGAYFLREIDAKIKVAGAPMRLDGQLLCP